MVLACLVCFTFDCVLRCFLFDCFWFGVWLLCCAFVFVDLFVFCVLICLLCLLWQWFDFYVVVCCLWCFCWLLVMGVVERVVVLIVFAYFIIFRYDLFYSCLVLVMLFVVSVFVVFISVELAFLCWFNCLLFWLLYVVAFWGSLCCFLDCLTFV